MTDKPTDEALENLFVEETGFDIDDFPAAIFAFTRAALTKWGQPAVKGDPVAWLSPWRKDQVTTDYDAYGKQGIPLVVAQQYVAREPLDEARRMFDAGWKAAALFCEREDVVADGITGFGASPQFEAAFSAAQGVLGGQHGTE